MINCHARENQTWPLFKTFTIGIYALLFLRITVKGNVGFGLSC